MGKVHLQSRSGKGSPGLGTGGAGLGNGKDQRAHLQVRDQGTLKLRGQALRQVPLRDQRSTCDGITTEGTGSSVAGQFFPSSVSVRRTSPDPETVPAFAKHLPQQTTLRAPCEALLESSQRPLER